MNQSPTSKIKVAVIGSGNIGTDLMIKVMRLSKHLEMGAMVGIDPTSDGLARAARFGVPTTVEGVDGLMAMDGFDDIEIVFDATSAKAHEANAAKLAPHGKRLIDLTPAAIGPFVVPAVNIGEHLDAGNALRSLLAPSERLDLDREHWDTHRPDGTDVAVFLLSGGTTGLPKLIARTHNDYAYNAKRSGEVSPVCQADVRHPR